MPVIQPLCPAQDLWVMLSLQRRGVCLSHRLSGDKDIMTIYSTATTQAPAGFLGRLDNLSDWLNPIVVKEVRQMVRGREFNYSFGLSLVIGLTVALFGVAGAMGGDTTSGSWIFAALTTCLTLVGLAVVPMGTFSALRNERAEQTLDLVILTTLTPRRLVIGKLLAQGIKLLTLFAGLSPFMAMSFLLGGIDLITILISLAVLFMWSIWACAV